MADFKYSPEAVTFLEKYPQYADLIRMFEEEFDVNGKSLKDSEDVAYFINADYPSPSSDSDYLDDGDGYTADIDSLFDFSQPEVEDIYYEEDKGRVKVQGEFYVDDTATYQSGLHDSGNYYEPPTWKEYNSKVRAAWDAYIIIPDDPMDTDAYEGEVEDYYIV